MPFDPRFDDYVSADTTQLFSTATTVKDKDIVAHLLWGDGVRFVGAAQGGRRQVRARGLTGWVATGDLGGRSLMEFYFIDVGQGDGLLIKTPDFRHLMLDGGYPRKSQPTGKSAADFVDWKFDKDYGHHTIVLDAMISSHIDFDHYGGLDDLLDAAQQAELNCTGVTVDHFFHSGLCHWAKFGTEAEGLGPYVTQGGKKWFTRLLDDRASAVAATTGSGPQARGLWGAFVGKLTKTKTAAGLNTPITRLSQKTEWLPGFAAGSSVPIRVLGPIEGASAGAPTLLRLASSASQNTNGTSVLLRVDFEATRTLLTGDLNANAHRALLEEYRGEERELSCDVAKSCHHGSEDVSFPFLNYVKAACTVISSGDAEGHDHPRPRIVAASGLSGYATFNGDELLTPLVYSTELARSVQVGTPEAARASAAVGGRVYAKPDLEGLTVDYKFVPPGALAAQSGSKKLSQAKVMHRLVYGLVNVRTDGRRILTATMNEGDGSFSTKTFQSRF